MGGCQRAPNPPEFAQPRLSRSNGGHPQREGANLGVFVPIWLVLPRREAINLGVFDLGHFALISPYSNGAVQIRVGLELAEDGPFLESSVGRDPRGMRWINNPCPAPIPTPPAKSSIPTQHTEPGRFSNFLGGGFLFGVVVTRVCYS